jgi:hypothetical protein
MITFIEAFLETMLEILAIGGVGYIIGYLVASHRCEKLKDKVNQLHFKMLLMSQDDRDE